MGGFPHPDYLLECLTSKQLSEWLAFYKMEPFGEEFDWIKSGIIAATIANANRGKNTPVFKPQDFIPEVFRVSRKKQSVDDMKSILMNIVNYTSKDNA